MAYMSAKNVTKIENFLSPLVKEISHHHWYTLTVYGHLRQNAIFGSTMKFQKLSNLGGPKWAHTTCYQWKKISKKNTAKL